MPASIFNGDAVKILKDKLRFKKGVDLECDTDNNIATANSFVAFKGTSKEIDVGSEVFESISTGVESFAGLSIGTPTTTFDVGAVVGHIVDLQADSYYSINFAGTTGVSPLTANGVTYVLIDNTGTLNTQTTVPTAQQRREKIFLGRVVTVGGTVVQVQDTPVTYLNATNQFYDLANAIRIFNIEGNAISPNTNLTFDKSQGKLFSAGANFTNNAEDPHEVSIGAGLPQSFAYITRDAGSTGPIVTDVDPGNYDNGGVITAISGSNNQATIQRVYLFPSGAVRVQYGQNIYPTLVSALQSIQTESFTENPNIATNGILIGFIVVTKGCSNLSTESDARLLIASRLGEGSIGASGLSTSTMQNTYDNSAQPQITLDQAKGGLQVRDAANPDEVIGDLLAIQDNAGTTNHLQVDVNRTAVTDRDGRQVVRKDYSEEYREDFKENDQTVFTLTGTGALSLETVNPIKGARSLKYTQAVGGSAGDIIKLTGIVPSEEAIGNLVGLLCSFKGSADLAAGYRVKLLESADDVTYTEAITLDIDVETGVKPLQITKDILSTSTHLGIEIEVLVASASHELILDELLIRTRPSPVVEFNNITDTEAFTPTGTWTTNTTYSGFKRRVGDFAEYEVKVSLTGAPNATNLRISIPDGAIDSSKMEANTNNFAQSHVSITNNGTGTEIGKVRYVNDSEVEIVGYNESTGYVVGVTNTSPFTFASGDVIHIRFKVPIVGWSATGEGVVTNGNPVATPIEKLLSSSTSGTGDASDLTVTGLTIGQWYEVGGGLLTSLSNVSTLDVNIRSAASNGGTLYKGYRFRSDDAQDSSTPTDMSFKFQATSTELYVYVNDFGGGNFLQGNGTKTRTWVQVTPINDVTVISPFTTEITTGVEYKTDKVLDGDRVYGFEWLETSVAVGDTTITAATTGLSTGLTIVGGEAIPYYAATPFYAIGTNVDTAGKRIQAEYNPTTGAIRIRNNQSVAFDSVRIILKYTK